MKTTRIKPTKMNLKTIQNINDELFKAGFDGNGRFRSVGHAYSIAGTILEKYGFEFAGMLDSWVVSSRPSGQLTLEISKSNPSDPFSPTEVSNTAMAFHFAKLGTSRVEVVAYLG